MIDRIKYTFFNYKKEKKEFFFIEKTTKMLRKICLKGIVLHENIKSLIDVLTYGSKKSLEKWAKLLNVFFSAHSVVFPTTSIFQLPRKSRLRLWLAMQISSTVAGAEAQYSIISIAS